MRALALVLVLALACSAVATAATRSHRGKRGPTGPTGPQGEQGLRGPAGPDAERPFHQAVSVSWQNGAHVGRDRAHFLVPGIGTGEIVCSPDIQWMQIVPDRGHEDTVMVSSRAQLDDGGRTQVVVSSARRERFTGDRFHEGLNRVHGEGRSHGTLEGIISSRGDRDAVGGPSPAAPTTFRMTWHWTFDDRFGARCYVAARFLTQ